MRTLAWSLLAAMLAGLTISPRAQETGGAEPGHPGGVAAACAPEIATACPGAQGDALKSCLLNSNNQSNLSDECKAAMANNVEYACNAEMTAGVCAGQTGREVFQCLKNPDNQSKLSEGCQAALAKMGRRKHHKSAD